MRALIVLVLLASVAHASEPVEHTTSGCVVGGVFYSVDGDWASRYDVVKPKLTKYEGKTIKMTGWLFPGDQFEIDGKVIVVAQKCKRAMRTAIKRAGARDLELAAWHAVDEGKLEKAVQLANRSIAVVTPADCDLHTTRAIMYAQKGDLAAARTDLAIVKARRNCRVATGEELNFNLLQSLAEEFVVKADKPSAVTALELARAACTFDACKDDIVKALDEAKKN